MKTSITHILVFALLAGHAAAAENDSRWHVILAAVGNEQVVFDNFILDFAATLRNSSQVASITQLHASVDERWKTSGMRELHEALGALQPGANEGCLVYLTGHGTPDGLAMSADVPTIFVRPTRMQSMLDSCSPRPTILIVSACFSGVYLRPGITRPERIVITASAADLTSFGCSNDHRYNFFDQCFLDAWSRSEQWGMLAEDVRNCVRQTERSGGFPASNPQFFFGPGLEALDLPTG